MLSNKTNQGSFQPKTTQFFIPSIIHPMALVVLPSYIMCCNPRNPNPSSLIAQPRHLCPLLPPPSLLLLSCIGPSPLSPLDPLRRALKELQGRRTLKRQAAFLPCITNGGPRSAPTLRRCSASALHPSRPPWKQVAHQLPTPFREHLPVQVDSICW
jgi:hypothetical protein